MRAGLPVGRPGRVVGLLGGSFDPAHEGHVAVTEAALRHFGLDEVWWLVSPGNPLKAQGPAPMGERLAAARRLMHHPKVTVTDIEARIGTRYTARTLRRLRALYPRVRFVWLMGADNMVQFTRWEDWREIIETVPVGVLARPGTRIAARLSRAARIYAGARIAPAASRSLGRADAPAWCFVNMPMSSQSSSALRAAGRWRASGGEVEAGDGAGLGSGS